MMRSRNVKEASGERWKSMYGTWVLVTGGAGERRRSVECVLEALQYVSEA